MRGLIRAVLSRPVAVTSAYVVVTAAAAVALVRLPVELLPDLRYPAVLVWTPYPNASPADVEEAVTVPVEEAVVGVPDLREVTSRSRVGGSAVRLDFLWRADGGRSLLRVRERLAASASVLPEGAGPPVVLRLDPSDRPVLVAAVQGDRPGGLLRYAEDVVARRVEQVVGVSRVRVSGGDRDEVHVKVDPDRAAALGVSSGDVAGALDAAATSLPGGVVREGPFRYAVDVVPGLRTAADVRSTVVRPGAPPVRVGDVASVGVQAAERRGAVRLDGAPAVLLRVETSPDANAVAVASDARAALSALLAEAPGVRFVVVVDESAYVRRAIRGVVQAVLLGGVLAAVVLFVFLRRRWAVAAVALAVPASLAFALALFEPLGVTVNLVSLGGLALAVGLVVDNAIVVAESVDRYRSLGRGPIAAAVEGTAEVAGAIVASTLTTAAVFVPITAVEGLAGRLFRDQAIAVVLALVGSLAAAVLVVPLVVSRGPGGGARRREERRAWLVGAERAYERVLEAALARPAVVLALAAAFVVAGAVGATRLPREVLPADPWPVARVTVESPPGTGLRSLSGVAAVAEASLVGVPGVEHVLADLGEPEAGAVTEEPRGGNVGVLTVTGPGALPAAHAAAAAAGGRAERARSQLEDLLLPPGGDLTVDVVGPTRAGGGDASGALADALRAEPDVASVVETGRRAAYRVRVDAAAAARAGLDRRSVGEAISSALGGVEAALLGGPGGDTPVVIGSGSAVGPDDLLGARVETPFGLRPLREFVSLERAEVPEALVRVGQEPVARLSVGLRPGADLAAGTAAVDRVGRGLPQGYRAVVGGGERGVRARARGARHEPAFERWAGIPHPCSAI